MTTISAIRNIDQIDTGKNVHHLDGLQALVMVDRPFDDASVVWAAITAISETVYDSSIIGSTEYSETNIVSGEDVRAAVADGRVEIQARVTRTAGVTI